MALLCVMTKISPVLLLFFGGGQVGSMRCLLFWFVRVMKPPLSGVNKGNGRKWKCSYWEDERTGRYTHGSEGTPDTFLFVKVEVLCHDLCSVPGLSFQQRRGKRRWLALAMYELTLAFREGRGCFWTGPVSAFVMYE